MKKNKFKAFVRIYEILLLCFTSLRITNKETALGKINSLPNPNFYNKKAQAFRLELLNLFISDYSAVVRSAAKISPRSFTSLFDVGALTVGTDFVSEIDPSTLAETVSIISNETLTAVLRSL